MIDYNLYSEYIDIVKKTNKIFDSWFFVTAASNNKKMSKKRQINQLSFSRQTTEIIDLLISAKAPEYLVEAFKIRADIETKENVSKEEIESALVYIKLIEKEYVEAPTLS